MTEPYQINRPLRILHAPSNVANIAWAMAVGLRGRGHHVEVWNHGPSPNNFPLDRVFELGKDPAAYVKCLLEALEADFDIFHFHGTRSLIPARGSLPMMWDLPLLHALGKRIVFTFHGSDIRLRSHHAAADRWSFYNFADIPCDEERIAKRMNYLSQYAHQLTVCCVHDLPYAPGARYIPKPIDVAVYPYVEVRRDRPVVLHATRRRETKGSDLIDAAIDRVRRTGLSFEYRVVENVSYQELLTALADADILVEKVLNGDAGVISLEAMAMGKIAIARIRPEVRNMHPDMPVVNADPESFEDVLVDLIQNWQDHRKLGVRGREYVERNHAPDVIAVQLEALYTPSVRHAKTAREVLRERPHSSQ